MFGELFCDLITEPSPAAMADVATMAPPPATREPRFGIKPPLGPSDEVHRFLRVRAMDTGSQHLGSFEKLVEDLAPEGYTAEDLERCIRDYSAIYNMYMDEKNEVHFTCMPQPPPKSWVELDPPLRH